MRSHFQRTRACSPAASRRPPPLGFAFLRIVLAVMMLGVLGVVVVGCSAANHVGEELSVDPSADLSGDAPDTQADEPTS